MYRLMALTMQPLLGGRWRRIRYILDYSIATTGQASVVLLMFAPCLGKVVYYNNSIKRVLLL